jgi:hypothetical protein
MGPRPTIASADILRVTEYMVEDDDEGETVWKKVEGCDDEYELLELRLL